AAAVGSRDTYELLDYFDEYDIQIQGRQFLENVLGCLHYHNQVVVGFVISWSHKQSKEKFESLLKSTNILEVFGEKLLAKHGEDFLTSALAHIRYSLRMVRRSQELSGIVEPRVHSPKVPEVRRAPSPAPRETSAPAPIKVPEQLRTSYVETVTTAAPSLVKRGSGPVSSASSQQLLAPSNPPALPVSSSQHGLNRRMVSDPVATTGYNGFGVPIQDPSNRSLSHGQVPPKHAPQYGSLMATPPTGRVPPHMPASSHPLGRSTSFHYGNNMPARPPSNVALNHQGHFPGTPQPIRFAPGINHMGMTNPSATAYPPPHAPLPSHLAAQLPTGLYN
ncbi:hypothetical protein LTS18_000904, partial [Coniosporium uncinatum]